MRKSTYSEPGFKVACFVYEEQSKANFLYRIEDLKAEKRFFSWNHEHWTHHCVSKIFSSLFPVKL